MGLIIKYLENKTNNVIDKRLEDVVMAIDFEILKPFETNCNYISYQIENVLENGNEIISNVVNLILAGEKKEDALKNYNLSQNQFDTYVRKYLPSNPELWVKYKIFSHDLSPINEEELKQIKEVVKYFITNLTKYIGDLILQKNQQNIDKKTLNLQIIRNKKLLKIYSEVLECLNYGKKLTNETLKFIEEDFIIDKCKHISLILKSEKIVDTNYATNKKIEESHNLYKKILNIR